MALSTIAVPHEDGTMPSDDLRELARVAKGASRMVASYAAEHPGIPGLDSGQTKLDAEATVYAALADVQEVIEKHIIPVIILDQN